MRRADRLFQIVQFLRGGRLMTARALAERLEVTPRTIYRDVADLMATGVPIEGEAGVGYVMRSGYDMPPLMFTSAEILALVTGARLARAWGGAEMASAAEEAIVKIEAVLPDSLRARAEGVPIHAFRMPDLPPEVRILIDRIEAATTARNRLILDYADVEGAETERTIRPLGLWFWGKVWTVVSWCELRNDFRMFRLDRIRSCSVGGPFRDEPSKRLVDFRVKDRPLDQRST